MSSSYYWGKHAPTRGLGHANKPRHHHDDADELQVNKCVRTLSIPPNQPAHGYLGMRISSDVGGVTRQRKTAP